MSWTRLSSTTIEMPADALVGLAVSSQNRNVASQAQFLGIGPTVRTNEAGWTHHRESATPSSRRTGLVISEIQYHPQDDAAGMEFVEIANHGDIFQEMTGWRLAGGIDYRFPDGFRLEAGAVTVVAANPALLQGVTGRAAVLGPWTGALNNAGDRLELRDNLDAIKLQTKYLPEDPWPVAADGTGHSLVLVSPSYGEDDPRAWGASWRRGGSPGRRDPLSAAPIDPVVINEFLAHTDLPDLDFIELFNRSTGVVDLSDWILTDNLHTNRFRIPPGTLLQPGTAIAFDETVLGFRLSAAGETLHLLSADASRVIDIVRFAGQENGVASGRHPNGANAIRRLAAPTPGSPNAPLRAEDIVINEIFYNPPAGDDDEFIEIHHRGDVPIPLGGWRLRGGISFTFPAGSTIAPGGFLAVARDQNQLRSNHPALPPEAILGNYSGVLNNGGDVVRIDMPDEIRSTNALGEVVVETIHITVGEVRFQDGGAWGKWSDGGGSSLELTDPHADPRVAANWADSDESGKGPWTTVEWTGRLDYGYSGNGINRLYLGLLNDGECLIDDIEVRRGTSTNFLQNAGFELGTAGWLLAGNHAGSTIDASGSRNGSLGLHLRAQGGLDTGVNSIRGTLSAGLAAGNTNTIRASVRWIAGWPEVLFRIRGNYADFAAPLTIPRNLGTPGRPNSRQVANAGPALYEVTHSPALPRAGDPVRITARASDPDAVTQLTLRHRTDPGTTVSEIPMRDDGLEGDLLAGDGLYTALIPPRAAGLLAFTIAATDGSGSGSVWPRGAPLDEGLIRWADPIHFGTFPHVHLWCTSANRNAVGGNALNNAYRRCTLVYGNTRVIYNTLFRDKGSPYHSGLGDITARTPDDDKLHGVSERLFSKTGNGAVEETALRGRVAAWLASQMGVPSLSGKYQFFYINGGSFANLVEDQEEPDHRYAEHHQPDNVEGDLYKTSIWFEYNDSNTASSFNATQATLEKFLSGTNLHLARYRWNWERRAQRFPESDYRTIFDLVNAIHSTSDAGYVSRLLQQADMDQWMHVFAFHRITGNWDSWTYNVGQNMYLYRQPGRRAVLFPWDIDFVLGLGDPATAAFWGGQDGVMNSRVYDNPTFRRMLWRALARAADGPMLPQNYLPVVEAYRAAQIQNNVPGLSSVSTLTNYMNSRRSNVQTRYRAADAPAFAILSNGGNDFTAPSSTITLTGTAPLRVADIMVNGVLLPVTWTGFTNFSISIPLTQATNDLRLVGLDRTGKPLADVDTVRVTYAGAIPQAEDWVVINEIHYNPDIPGTSFIELHNRHVSSPFNLAGFRLDGIGYTFPADATIGPGKFLLLVADRTAFVATFGFGIPIFDAFTGSLDNDGERLRLFPPGSAVPFSEVRYLDRMPWPAVADGSGPSLQLIDPAQDTRRPANWAATSAGATNRITPGAANATRATLAGFPAVWINEVLPQPGASILDNAGETAPFAELHNPGATPADLAGLWLSDSPTNLARWRFPSGTTVPAGGVLRIWMDAQPEQSAAGHLHASFALPPGSGALYLAQAQGSPATPAVLDWVEYQSLPPERGFGSIPDGNPYPRRQLYVATPGALNDPSVPVVEVVLNEFMAQNTTGLTDPADGHFDDWLELYNPGSQSADLSGYYLTDDLTNRTASILPPGTVIPPGGFVLVWADGDLQQTDVALGRFHAGFSLSRSGEQLGLYAPDGSLVDGLSFGPQTNNVSMARYPDGPEGSWTPLETPTPEALNFVPGGNLPPRFVALPIQTIPEESPWTLRVVATDPDPGQIIRFSLGADAPPGLDILPATGLISWTPDESQGPGLHTFTVRATDSGTPSRSSTLHLQVQVTEANRAPQLAVIPASSVGEGSALSFDVSATDPDRPAQGITYSLVGNPPTGAAIDSATGRFSWIPAEDQGPGDFDLTVRATDSGFPAASTTHTFRVHVDEVDNPPILAQPNPQMIDEGSSLVLELRGSDPDGAAVRFSLAGDIPAGLTLDAVTGVLRWLPGETQGPGSYPLIVRVTEQSELAQTAQATFSILVREVNTPPVLAALPALTRAEGDRIELGLSATDLDLPASVFSYAIEGSAPGNPTIDVASGALSWTLPQDIGATNLALTLRVSDDGTPTLSASQVLRVTVLPRFRVVLSEIMSRPAVPGAAYVELLNASRVTPWDLSGMQLVGNSLTFAFPEGTVLPPGGVLCVVQDTDAFRAAYGTGPQMAGPWAGSLGAAGDDLRLIGSSGELLDRVAFAASAPWPEQPVAGGASLQLVDPFADNARGGNWTCVASFSGPRQPVTYTTSWRYLDSGAPVGAWTGLDFDDRSWRLGGGLLYWEESALPAPKTTALSLGQISYYFRTAFVLPASPTGATLSLFHIIDDAGVFYLNGAELARFNFGPSTVITPTALAETAVGNAAIVGPVNLPGTQLRAGTNILAAEVHQNASGSSDIVLGAQLDIVGGTVAAYTPGTSNQIAAILPEFPDVFLNELAPAAGPHRDSAGESEPWVELFNAGPEDQLLQGWTLSASGTASAWSFPSNSVLRAGERRVIFLDAEPVEHQDTEWHASFRPVATGGWVAVARPAAVGSGIVDALVYGSSSGATTWSAVPEGQPFAHAWTPPTPAAANPAPTAAPPELAIQRSGEGLTLRWAGQNGVRYRLESQETLGGAWQFVRSLSGSGSTLGISIAPPSSGSRFYRVAID
jgi:hypothetical protein